MSFAILLRVSYASNAFAIEKLEEYCLGKKWKFNNRTPWVDIEFVKSSKRGLSMSDTPGNQDDMQDTPH